MGVGGLLRCLKRITKAVNVKQYKGFKVGIDISCWLHRGAYSCSKELAEGLETNKYITFCLKMLHLLVSCGLLPLVVFDGGKLPIKQATNSQRNQNR